MTVIIVFQCHKGNCFELSHVTSTYLEAMMSLKNLNGQYLTKE
ncbi:hypothetical protein [Pseudoalteromonas luteoviolacea]|nr:hypothetical protein [Pseudoalteromonas luteoviolacea]